MATVAAAVGDRLHRAGVPVTTERSSRFAAALDLVRPATYDELYWTARVNLLSGHEQIDVFDRVFRHVFGELADIVDAPAAPGSPRPSRGSQQRSDLGSDRPGSVAGGGRSGAVNSGEGDEDAEGSTLAMTMSAAERLHRADFAALTPGELARMRALMAQLRLAPPPRRRRRTVRSAQGRRLDRRATLRHSQRTGGDPVHQVLRRPAQRPRRLVLIADVSGSMEPYARAYLQLLHSAVGGPKAEAFVFATRLTRLTRQLRLGNPTAALQRAALTAPDWAGGTRIGETLKVFNDEWGRRGLARGAVIVIVSDGWDSGDPSVLGEQMERLSRLAHRIVWVNPRAQHATYRPLVGGMAAALPHVDAFLSGHSVDAMQAVIDAIGDLRPTTPPTYPV